MKVFVTTYHKYNCGNSDGTWLDLDLYDSYEDFEQEAKEYHKDESDPELFFTDYEMDSDLEGLFSDNIREYFDYKNLIVSDEYLEDDEDFIFAIANHYSLSVEQILNKLEYISDYAYYVGSLEEYFYDIMGLNIPKDMEPYIDWEGYTESLCIDYIDYKDGYLVFTE